MSAGLFVFDACIPTWCILCRAGVEIKHYKFDGYFLHVMCKFGEIFGIDPGGWGNGSSKMCSGGILILISSQSFCSLCVIVHMTL